LFRSENDGDVELGALLRGALTPARAAVAISILGGVEVPLSDDDLDALLAVPSDRWVPAAAAGDPDVVHRLALAGLVVSDAPDDSLVELRRRDEQLTAHGWNLYAALYHSMTRRIDTDLELAEDLDERRRTKAATAVAKRTARGGPPPPVFHRSPLARSVHDLPLDEETGALFELLQRRSTGRTLDPEATMTTAQLSTILRTVFGSQGVLDHGNGYVLQKKTSPSGGALHPIEAYPLIRRVDGFEPGLYHYDVERHALALLEPLEEEAATEYLRFATCGQAHFSHAQVAFVLTARFRRNFWKYWRQKDQYGVLLLDAGHLSQTLYLVATELGLDPFVTAVINHDALGVRLGLDRYDEGALAVCGCGVALPSRLKPQFTRFAPRRPG
jgi:putative peptide maturation dehydrogenase